MGITETTITPKVSIGMPVYNGALFIREALDSLLAQTFTNFELIISDNASSDGTDAICQEYAVTDQRVRYIRQSENRGVGKNFKFVLDEAVGDYFMWAAADDVWDRSWIDSLVSCIDDKDVVVYGTAHIFNEERTIKVFRPRNFMRNSLIGFFLDRNHKAIYSYGLFDREKLNKMDVNVLQSNCSSADHIMLMSLLQYGNFRSVTENQQMYRIHGDQVSAKNVTKYIKMFRALNIHLFCYYYNAVRISPWRKKIIIVFLTPLHFIFSFFVSLRLFVKNRFL